MTIFFHFLEIAMINSRILYNKEQQKAKKSIMSHLDYRKSVIRSLMFDLRTELDVPTTERKRKIDKISPSPPLGLQKCCFIEDIPLDGYATNRKYCKECKDNHEADPRFKKRQTRSQCGLCKVPLCEDFCFAKHLKSNPYKSIQKTLKF